MATTSIQWTDRTWNPVTGCTKVSAGCKHCYAEGVANRFWAAQYPAIPDGSGMHADGERPRRFTDVQCHDDRLLEPLKWRKPARVFVNSMSDLFHENVDYDFVVRVFGVMELAHRHTFQVLTKRASRMLEIVGHPSFRANVSAAAGIAPIPWPLPNVWLGTSIEDQPSADQRIPELLATPAAVRFVSYEPALGLVDFSAWLRCAYHPTGRRGDCACAWPRLDWVIAGGESGPGARPCNLAWIRSVIEQCHAASVPPFVKQLGAFAVWDGCGLVANNPKCDTERVVIDGREIRRLLLKDRKGGDPSEWPEDLRVREYPHRTPHDQRPAA